MITALCSVFSLVEIGLVYVACLVYEQCHQVACTSRTTSSKPSVALLKAETVHTGFPDRALHGALTPKMNS